MTRNPRPALALLLIVVMLQLRIAGCGRAHLAERPIVRENGVVLSELAFPEGKDDLVLPLRKVGSLLLTDAVHINGKSVGWMVIDTGAGWSCIDHATARALGIAGEDQFWKPAPGEKFPNGLYRIDTLDVGGMTLRNHVIGEIDLSRLNGFIPGSPRIVGVVGDDVFAATPFTIDAPGRELVLHRRSTFRPPRKSEGVYHMQIGSSRTRGSYFDASPLAGQPIVRAKIDDVDDAAVLLDSGSGAAIALQPGFVKSHPQFVAAGAKTAGIVHGAGGPNGLDGRKLVHANVKHFGLLGAWMDGGGNAVALEWDDLRDRTAATVGQPFLRNGRLTFDFATGRIWPRWQRQKPTTAPATPHLTLSPHPL